MHTFWEQVCTIFWFVFIVWKLQVGYIWMTVSVETMSEVNNVSTLIKWNVVWFRKHVGDLKSSTPLHLNTAPHKRPLCLTECELPVSLGDGADPESKQHPWQFVGEGFAHSTGMWADNILLQFPVHMQHGPIQSRMFKRTQDREYSTQERTQVEGEGEGEEGDGNRAKWKEQKFSSSQYNTYNPFPYHSLTLEHSW